jgi:hypothetical protein
MKYALNNTIWTSQEFIRLICTRWETLDEALRRFEWLREESKKPRDERDLVAIWLLEHYGEKVEKYTIQEAGKETNPRRRRTIFWSIRPERCFPSLNPTKIDEVKRVVTRTFWDEDGNAEIREVHQHYVLWEVDGSKMGITGNGWGGSKVVALQCWCPTTNKEFWIIQRPWTGNVDTALCNMMRLNRHGSAPGPMYRHGDILFKTILPENERASLGGRNPLEMLQAET